MGELISVIVPIYKVEPYLKKCLDSIINQTYRNLEIILVDDGSPDNCGAICDEYAKQDSRIVVIHKPNGGLSDARNAGLDIMKGQYVGFVDSDDFIEKDMYEVLLENMKSLDADMSFGGIVKETEKNGLITHSNIIHCENEPYVKTSSELRETFFNNSWAAWDKLYKAELFQNVRFPVGEINEDEAIALYLIDSCNKVCYTKKVFYHYIRREKGGSITTSTFSHKQLDWAKHCKANLDYVTDKHPELIKAAAYRYRWSIMWSLIEISMLDDVTDFTDDIDKLLLALKQNKKLFKSIPFDSVKEKLRYVVIYYLGFDFYRKMIRIIRRA